MDGLVFFKLMRILGVVLAGAKLNRISAAAGSVYFSFYKDGPINLEFRSTPAPPLLSVVADISGDSPGALAAVAGATVSSVSAFGYDRAGAFEFKKRRPSGKLITYKAVIEPAGNYANFFLLDDEDTILFSLSSRTIDPDRDIGAGSRYSKPRPNKRFTLDDFEKAESFADLAGFYPVTAKYADRLSNELGFTNAAAVIKEALFEDDLFYIDNSSKVIPFPIPDPLKTISWHEIGGFYPKKESKDNASRVTDSIKKFFSSRYEKYQKLAAKLRIELEQADNTDPIVKEAELIKANLYKVKSSGVYIFERYTENGVEQIEYDVLYGEDLGAKSDRLFKKANRLKRSVPMIRERLEESIQLANSALEQIDYAESGSSYEDMAEFERIIREDEKKGAKQKVKKPSKQLFNETGTDDYKISLGRNSASNHQLVFRYAIASDIWFHARNIPSAHLILRLEGGQELTDTLITHAAKIVARFSKMKNQAKVDIDYTFRRYVNKPKNTPAGFVTYKNFKTVTVEPYSEKETDELFGL